MTSFTVVIARVSGDKDQDAIYKYRNHRWETDDKEHRLYCSQDAVWNQGFLYYVADDVTKVEKLIEERNRYAEWYKANVKN